MHPLLIFFFFFFNDTATTEIYTLSLHDALPISHALLDGAFHAQQADTVLVLHQFADRAHPAVAQVENQYRIGLLRIDRKSTRLNSSHQIISYAVFCLKKKNKHKYILSP